MSEPPLNDLPQSSEIASDPSGGVPSLVATDSSQQGGFLAGLVTLWTVLFRLLVLGMGVSLAWLAGAVAAQFLPSPTPKNPPFQEIALRQANRLSRKVQQLPHWWSEDLTQGQAAPAPASSPEPVAPAPLESPADPKLAGAEREAVESELSALETELDALDNRLADLEIKLGQPVSDASLENRLRRLSRTLVGETVTRSDTSSTPSTAPASPPVSSAGSEDPLFQLARDRITLPSSLLFAPGQSLLIPDAEPILDTLLSDLSRYPGATLVVGSHSDGPGTTEEYRSLTFKQALAVEQYLASRLGEGYRWVSVGYGQSQPLVPGESKADQQRNQRIEIAIVPER